MKNFGNPLNRAQMRNIKGGVGTPCIAAEAECATNADCVNYDTVTCGFPAQCKLFPCKRDGHESANKKCSC